MTRIVALLLVLFSLSAISGTSQAARFIFEGDIGPGGTVTELGPEGTVVNIRFTGPLPGGEGTTGVTAPKEVTIGPSGRVSFTAPREGITPQGDTVPVTDFFQTSTTPNAGEVSALSVFAFSPVGDDFAIRSFMSFVEETVGTGVPLTIPDLYADTNGDGQLGSDDLLFSAVNLVELLDSLVSFTPGDLGGIFDITGGVSSEFPGFVFGTSPIALDPNELNGISNPAPYTGPASRLTDHVITVAEPSIIVLFASGLALISIQRSRSLRGIVGLRLRYVAAGHY